MSTKLYNFCVITSWSDSLMPLFPFTIHSTKVLSFKCPPGTAARPVGIVPELNITRLYSLSLPLSLPLPAFPSIHPGVRPLHTPAFPTSTQRRSTPCQHSTWAKLYSLIYSFTSRFLPITLLAQPSPERAFATHLAGPYSHPLSPPA